ncbi:MAG: hypothetical protein ACRDRU_05405 [Pseudonocardiaceae bacterium]
MAEQVEMCRYLAHHPPLKPDEAFQWEGNLFTGYHFCKVKRNASMEHIKWPD